MNQTIVLGIGNRLMMDDGIGIYVVENLKKKNGIPAVSYVVGETDVYYCLAAVKDAGFLIVIDAADSGNKPGQVTVHPVSPGTGWHGTGLSGTGLSGTGLSAHNLHFLDLVNHFHKDLKGILVGVQPFEIGFNLGLSRDLNNLLPEITTKIEKIISSATPSEWPASWPGPL